MLLIRCPHCGPRDQVEFVYGGDASVKRPVADAPAEAWHAYVYLRDNPAGPHEEYWQHHAGCRQWIKLRRDTVTHEILEAK
jgi:heterotetrameric sarcosine oxidase delta subunit